MYKTMGENLPCSNESTPPSAGKKKKKKVTVLLNHSEQ